MEGQWPLSIPIPCRNTRFNLICEEDSERKVHSHSPNNKYPRTVWELSSTIENIYDKTITSKDKDEAGNLCKELYQLKEETIEKGSCEK